MIKLTFKKEELLKALDYCSSCIDKKHPMLILTSVLFSFKDKECTLNATNLEITVIAKVNLEEPVNEGKIAAPARSVHDICRLSRAETIILKYDESNNVLDITADKSEYKVPCFDPSDFPEISDTYKEYKSVDISKFISFYKKVQFSMGDYFSTNKAYSGVLITKVKEENGKTSIDMVTTDIHRLSVLKLKNFDLDIPEIEKGIIIPGKNFVEITNIFADCTEAQIAIDNEKEEKIFIKKDNVIFISRLFKNEFPKYSSIISSYEVLNSKEFAVINRKELIEAIKRVVIVLNSEDKNWISKYFFNGNVLKLTASSSSGGNSSDEIVMEKGFSTERSVAVNAKYFLDVINVIDDSNVNVIVEEAANKAMIIKEESDDFFYIHMVMPLRI
jgi:DNA polymerase-3 subunit beta